MNERITIADLATIDPERDNELFEALRDPTEQAMDRHMRTTKDWSPHHYVPYDMARTYSKDKLWELSDGLALSLAVRSALEINTLTEDNLPEYFHLIALRAAGSGANGDDKHPLVAWSKQWKAEEDRHGHVMGVWIEATRAVDPQKLQQDRMAFLSKGETPQPDTISEMLAYTALQELATRVSHNNTGKAIDKEIGDKHNGVRHMGREMLGIVAADESRHHHFYASLAAAAMRYDPSTMTIALGRQLVKFEMPGVGIPDFIRRAAPIARAGIYGQREFRHGVLGPTMREIGYDSIRVEDLSPQAQFARLAIDRYVQDIDARLAKKI